MGDRQNGSHGTVSDAHEGRPVHIGVIGFGYWGPNHVRVLSRTPGTQTAVIDPDAGGTESASYATRLEFAMP